jgi:hypothetical protein
VTRLGAKQASALWAVTVLSVWILITVLLVILSRATFGHFPIGGFVPHAATYAAFLCVVDAGPPTAVTLWLRQRRGAAQSVLGGLAAGALVFALVYLAGLHAGALALTAVAPVLVVIGAEFTVALSLRRVRVRRTA